MRTILVNGRVVLADRVAMETTVLIDGPVIAAVGDGRAAADAVVDLRGDWLLPGLVDLHCDAIEKDVEPRPGVRFPLDFAIASADRRNAACGITTAYHAISFAQDELGLRDVGMAGQIVESIRRFRPAGLVDNRTHLRHEITDRTGVPVIAARLAAGDADLLSFMDHSPGQGQYPTLDAYRDYLVRTYHKTPSEAERLAREKLVLRGDAGTRIECLAALAREHAVPLASHDDDCVRKVREMSALGVSVAEFPTCLAAACEARAQGVFTVFGAPNVVRGRSQSGALRALDAVRAGVAGGLCADYAPAALLAAVFRLPEISDLGLPQAVAMASSRPARAVGLRERGEIAAGQRADLVAVRLVEGWPQATATWCGGALVHQADYARVPRAVGLSAQPLRAPSR